MFCFYVFFFFSSRRRHTRCSRDWSSDVCSSDLRLLITLPSIQTVFGRTREQSGCRGLLPRPGVKRRRPGPEGQQAQVGAPPDGRALFQGVVAPIREKQAGGSQRRRGVHGVERLQQILDEPEAFGTGLQPVRNGEASE